MLGPVLKFVKIVLLTWVLCPLVLFALAVFSTQAQAISLKQNVLINSDTIKLADVFDDLPRGGDKVLGLAPKPGQEMTLNSRTLLRIALALDLPWRPASNIDSVTIKRNATIVSQSVIEDALKKAFTDKGISGKYNVSFSQGETKIILPAGEEPAVEVSALNVKPENGWFEATLSAPSAQNPLQVVKISGILQQLSTVPVLKEALNNGSIIGKQDIDYIDVPTQNLKQNTVLSADALVGMTPRRLAAAGKTLQNNDIESPRLITRGDTVTMIFREGPLLLTAQGKATEHGTKGDQIKVINTSSNQAIDAIVTNNREVTIQNF